MGVDKIKFYRDKPLFGMDIGHASLKVMQIDHGPGRQPTVLGYGSSYFAPEAIQNGEITNPKILADALHQLFEKNTVGSISSQRVACALPTSHTFSRPMKIPPMEHSAIREAIQLEAEQYIPMPISNLYLDYEIARQDAQGIELLLVAAPRKIVDSYLKLLESLNLEPLAFEPSINAASRLLHLAGESGSEPTIVLDIGAVTSDIAIYDKTLLVVSTVSAGGDTITNLIAREFHMSYSQAASLKDQFGISYSDKQARIIAAVKPQLDTLVHEMQKSLRYYNERAAQLGRKISQIVTVGGGAVMPGLNHYLSKELQLPTMHLEPWQTISFGKLAVPPAADQSMYLTVAGEAILDPAEAAR